LIGQLSDQTLRAPADCGSVADMRASSLLRHPALLAITIIALGEIASAVAVAGEIPAVAQRQRA